MDAPHGDENEHSMSVDESCGSNIVGEVTSGEAIRVPLEGSPPPPPRRIRPGGRGRGGRTGETSAGPGRGGRTGETGGGAGEGGGRYTALRIRASNHPDVIRENKAAAAQAKHNKHNPKEK